MKTMQPETIAILRAIVRNPSGLADLREINEDARRIVINLQTHKYVTAQIHGKNENRTYEATPAGERKLKSIDSVPGQMPAPRQHFARELYAGMGQTTLRPGAMLAYELCSLVDGKQVERRRPMIIGGAHQGRIHER